MYKTYCIKKGYCSRNNFQKSEVFVDTKEFANMYQIDVYKFAQQMIKRFNLCSVLDIGCGFGIKLKKYILPICNDITGIDLDYTINFCKRTHHFGKWINMDVECNKVNLNKKFDLIICCDVIEHLFEPDKLFDYIKDVTDKNSWIIVSTPERDKVYGKEHNGPPLNKTHIREWNSSEFKQYLLSHKFKIFEQFLAKPFRRNGFISLIDKLRIKKTCQIILCKKI